MKKYEIDWNTLIKAFPTDRQCIEYFQRLKWGSGFVCSRCGCNECWSISEIKFKCKNCGYQSTLTTGTMFQNSHLPLLQWFRAIWYIVSCRGAVDATEFQKAVNIGSNRTALSVLNKIRDVMGQIEREKFSGIVYVDYFRIFTRTKKELKDAYIAIAKDDDNFLRIKMKLKKAHTTADIGEFIENCIAEESTVFSAKVNFLGYYGEFDKRLPHNYRYKASDKIGADNKLLITKKILTYLKDRQLINVHQGSCSLAHSERYLSECCYKFNRRNKKSDKMFNEILKFMIRNEISDNS